MWAFERLPQCEVDMGMNAGVVDVGVGCTIEIMPFSLDICTGLGQEFELVVEE
jgi:hypothetical protein